MNDWPSGYGKRVLAQIDSTNAEAARIAPNLAGPEWILGLEQTAGRGRRGRAWADPAGNFAATLVMRPTETPDQVALRSFVAALALYDAFAAATGRSDGLALKWPNDVLLNGGKVAGILLESSGHSGGVSHIAIGIGVNLKNAPDPGAVEPGALRPVSLLGETGIAIPPEDFLGLLAPAYARLEAQFCSYGFAPIRRLWLDRAARLGEVITARTLRHEQTGTFETVDAAGNLVLSTAQGRVAIPAAEIFF
ncbi:Bifunctional protein BirA [Thalassovita gelatinovora]|uniref:biotin--[biotin carboxyl-carrier protein] ligase n=1 Tax=Thalassovita gelatinovora TaxID=53501 RepID=A0A0P1G2D0_THAGE|nr:biotin--[acetyl-CoA-carboxylase] ligase [Thalassovita gelatinovora]QIZ79827.1 biotin--[acetyl-CoA-carboxylase] ligase [Thalassovita gelatinovora]CUH66894.1 Bifunctional protein BirA [Thalassovita gelatinovora]SEQ44724.1 BirA family transcriptional regulator, biotin operon repressor / biotin-[acetyl-CoA-carboxylase] ligase [Thalassovita gelatinovora]